MNQGNETEESTTTRRIRVRRGRGRDLVSGLKNEWLELSVSDLPQDVKRQKEILEKIGPEKMPAKEGFSIQDYEFGTPKTHSGSELQIGTSYSKNMLDINELFEKGIVLRGDKINLTNFQNINTIQAASQEQLDMLTPQSKDQITSVHLSNNTDLRWGNYFAQNEKSMDESIDLSTFKNLKNLEAHFYLNSDLRKIKVPENTDHILMQASCTPRLRKPENVDVFLNDAKTTWGTWDMSYNRDFPTNHEEAEKLLDERLGRSFRIHLDTLQDKNGAEVDHKELVNLVDAYPDLTLKTAEALYRNSEEYTDWDQDSDALEALAKHPSAIKGKTVMDVYPEVALFYYDEKNDKDEFASSKEAIQFGVEHPNFIPLLSERLQTQIAEHPSLLEKDTYNTSTLLDLAVVGAANPKHTDNVRAVLEQCGRTDFLQDMDSVISQNVSMRGKQNAATAIAMKKSMMSEMD